MKARVFFFIILAFFHKAHAQHTIKLVLNHHPNPTQGPIYEIKRQGLDHKHGFHLDIIVPSNFQIGPKMVAMKKADITLTYAYYLHKFVRASMPLKHMATLIDKPMNALMTINPQLKSPKDLFGKKIGIHGMGTGKTFITSMLKTYSMDEKDVTFVPLKNNGYNLLIHEKIDALSGINPVLDKPLAEKYGKKAYFMHYQDHGIPAYEELIIITHQDNLKKPWAKDFNRALKESLMTFKKDFRPCRDFMQKVQNAPMLYSVQTWRELMPFFSKTPSKPNIKSYEALIAFFEKHGHNGKRLTASDLL